MPVILAALGDITKQDVDAIVNAANHGSFTATSARVSLQEFLGAGKDLP